MDTRAFASIAAKGLEKPAETTAVAEPSIPAPRSNALVLRLGKPFSTNAMYRSFSRGRSVSTIKSREYRDWQERTLAILATQKWTPVEGSFGLQIKLPKGTRIDLDNTAKAFLDVLRAGNVIVDDAPKHLRRLEIVLGLTDFTTLTIKPLEAFDAMD